MVRLRLDTISSNNLSCPHTHCTLFILCVSGKVAPASSKKQNSKKGKEDNEVLDADDLGLGGEIAIDPTSVVQSNVQVLLMKKIDVTRLKHGFVTVAIPEAPWFLRVEFLLQLLQVGWRNKYPNSSEAWITTLVSFNCRGDEYGDDSKYKRRGTSNKTYNGLAYTHVYDLSDSSLTVLNDIKRQVEYLFRLLQKRDRSSCGELFVDYMVRKAHDPLFRYFLKENNNDHDRISVSINEELHLYGTRSIEYTYDEHYDKCFVDFDIKGLLNKYAGVSSWDDASKEMKCAVYKSGMNKKLRDWDTIRKEAY